MLAGTMAVRTIGKWLGCACASAILDPALHARVNSADAAAPIVRRSKDGAFVVQSRRYRAVVAHDGSLTSLQTAGIEFLTARPHAPRGAYVYQNGPLRFSGTRQTAPQTITAEHEAATIEWEFTPDSIRWRIRNRSRNRLLALIVFARDVEAVQDRNGLFWPTPAQTSAAQRTVWYRETAALAVQGGTRVWGPWADGLQVWQADIPPGKESVVVLTPGRTSAAERTEIRRAKAWAAFPPEEPEGPMWDLERFSRPPPVHPAAGFEEPGVRAVFFDGPPFRGRRTRVFAWIGIPEHAGEKVPGIVLVHGGGGTAFADWVRLWNRRGYAAIALDTCGCTPGGKHAQRPRHPDGGPPGWGGFEQIDWPRTDQWTWHAVADILLAHSLLRSLPEVDPNRTGITGISWGGYLTCIAAGVDHRFRFAAPIYGCGFTDRTVFAERLKALPPEARSRWMRWWDPSVYLPHARMPMLWMNGTNDFAYTLDAWVASCRLPRGPRTMSIRLRMPHGQEPGQAPVEIRIFADSIVRGGVPLPEITESGRRGDTEWAAFRSATRIQSAHLLYTCDTGRWQDREWKTAPARIDAAAGRVTARLPAGAVCWFLNLIDEREALVSTLPVLAHPQ